MDLGSLVCSPKSPKCEACPLLNYCAQQRQENN